MKLNFSLFHGGKDGKRSNTDSRTLGFLKPFVLGYVCQHIASGVFLSFFKREKCIALFMYVSVTLSE